MHLLFIHSFVRSTLIYKEPVAAPDCGKTKANGAERADVKTERSNAAMQGIKSEQSAGEGERKEADLACMDRLKQAS